MKNKPKKSIIAVTVFIVAGLLVCTGVLTAVLISENGQSAQSVFGVSSTSSTGRIVPVIQDGNTGEPVEGATVVIPEVNESYITDSEGKTEEISLPIKHDARFREILEKPWGEATILIYKDGYVPSGLFGCLIPPGETRQGPTILLFKQQDLDRSDAVSFVEGPNKTWADAVIEKYRP